MPQTVLALTERIRHLEAQRGELLPRDYGQAADYSVHGEEQGHAMVARIEDNEFGPFTDHQVQS